jgi:hypothetical protein
MTSGRPRLAAVRRAVGLVVILVLLGCAVAFYRVAPKLPTTPAPPSTTTGAPTLGSRDTPDGTRASTAAPSSSGSATATRAPIPERKAGRGPGRTSTGIYLTASPASDGTFDVAESVVLDAPVASLKLRLPPIGDVGSDVRSLRPRASSVQVSANRQPVIVPDGRVAGDVELLLTSPAKRFELRYRLTGVTARTAGSTAGRALAGLGPLTSGVSPDLPVAIAVRGRAVRNLLCPHFKLASQRACAAGPAGDLRVNRNLPWRQAVIGVQLDLPRP